MAQETLCEGRIARANIGEAIHGARAAEQLCLKPVAPRALPQQDRSPEAPSDEPHSVLASFGTPSARPPSCPGSRKWFIPPMPQIAIAQASRDAGTKKRRQHDAWIVGYMIFALDDVDPSFASGCWRWCSRDPAGCEAHYFSFPTTASIFSLSTGIVNGLAITLLTPSFWRARSTPCRFFPVSRIKAIFEWEGRCARRAETPAHQVSAY